VVDKAGSAIKEAQAHCARIALACRASARRFLPAAFASYMAVFARASSTSSSNASLG